MVKRLLLFLMVLGLPSHGQEAGAARLVDMGTERAVIFEKTASPDGNYALGWTILLKNKAAKPVDWSQWSGDGVIDFVTPYLGDSEPPDTAYQIVDGVIDLKRNKFLPLPTDRPYFPHENHADFAVAWSPTIQGRRYVLINNDARFFTQNLWLVVIDPDSWQQKDLVQALGKAVDPVLRQDRPSTYDGYGTNYSVAGNGTKGIFDDSSATISFTSDIPKSEDENSEVDGTVTISLPDGRIIRAVSTPTNPTK